MALIPELAAELASDEDSQAWLALAENPGLLASVHDALAARNDPYVLRNLILNQTTLEPLRAQLYEQLARAVDDRSAHILSQASQWLWKLPLEEALAYLDSPHALIRRELAARKDLPAEAAARLDRDADLEVRTRVARRLDTPGDLLEQIVRDIITVDPWNAPPMYLTDHPNFPLAAFVHFASAPEAALRAVACRDPYLPSDVVSKLAHDRDEAVQRAAAGHRNLPAGDAIWLLGLESSLLVEAAAASPALPPAAIDHILIYAAQGR